ncbi:MAG TPA: hypothetical protein VMC48_00225, partial [Methanobacterium sp.]|nr:hypothetical protein [Methanobacterium sp.]
KKMVAGEKKVYEYNQYQVPLKKSDNLACSEEVFIIPQEKLESIIASELEAHQDNLKQHRGVIAEYKKELKDLEWKHGELSRSYKALVSKNAQNNKRLRLEGEKNNTLNEENQKLKNQLQRLYGEYKNLKDSLESESKKADLEESTSKKEQDLWSSLRNRFSSREVKDQEESDQ